MTTASDARLLAGLRVERVAEKMGTINLLVYGEPGVGKTLLCGSADAVPDMRPVLLIDVEGGSFTLRQKYPDLDVVRVKTWNEIQAVYDELHAGRTPYKTVIIDSLTEVQKFSMYEILRLRGIKKPDSDADIAEMHDWGKNIEQIRRFVRAFRDLSSINVLFTALATSDQNKKTGLVTKKPYLSGKLASEVAGFLDIVMYMYTKSQGEEILRLLLTGTTEEFVAKDRSAKLPMVVQDPTMQTIYDLINETNPTQPTE